LTVFLKGKKKLKNKDKKIYFYTNTSCYTTAAAPVEEPLDEPMEQQT
jgi:hypothetical protein